MSNDSKIRSDKPADSSRFSRRDWLKGTALLAAGAAFGGVNRQVFAAHDDPKIVRPKPVLRVAHLTDVHVQPELDGERGLVQCIGHVEKLAQKPGLILTGGDCVMDSFAQEAPRTKELWDIWGRSFKENCDIPLKSCLGNHDIWGGNKAKSKTTGREPQYGKKWACDILGLDKPYHSFDQAGWHFIMLDSIQPGPKDGSYTAKVDDEQLDWLKSDLENTSPKTPVLVVSHAPIFSATVLLGQKRAPTGERMIPSALMIDNSDQIISLFQKHSNVKLCLSGHMHRIDRVTFRDVTYICDGAVCGSWWKGNFEETHEGYGVIDLYLDGAFEHKYTTYGWKSVAKQEKKVALAG